MPNRSRTAPNWEEIAEDTSATNLIDRQWEIPVITIQLILALLIILGK